MNTQILQMLETDRRWLESLRADIPAMARAVGEEVADTIETEISNEAKSGIMPDIAKDLQRTLQTDASKAFEDEIDRQLLQEMRRHSEQMRSHLAEQWQLDSERQSLDSLRKSIRLAPQLKPQFDRIFRKAKPLVVTQLFRAIAHDVEDMEKEWLADGEALCDAFDKERDALERTISKAAESLLEQLRLDYRRALEQALRLAETNQLTDNAAGVQ